MKMKPIHVKISTCIDSQVEYDDKGPKFEVGHHKTISKYKIHSFKLIIQKGLKNFL